MISGWFGAGERDKALSYSAAVRAGQMPNPTQLRRTQTMAILESLIGPITSIIDKIIPDKEARAKAKLELLELQGTQEMDLINSRLSAIVAEANSRDPWTSRARPSFLYVMYTIMLFSLPMGILSAFNPSAAANIGDGITGYLRGLPEELYALFGTGYLGYTAARQWGKVKGVEQ